MMQAKDEPSIQEECDALVGGLYGVRTGHCFNGESMFTAVSGAGKCALVHFSEHFTRNGGRIIDCQMETPLLAQFGGHYISRQQFLRELPR